MPELLTAAQMRSIENAAIDSGSVTGSDLMERAGRGVVDAILDWRPELANAPHRAIVLCGPGNNGGDGFVVARLLKQRGWNVDVYLYGDEAKLPPDAAQNYRKWCALGEVRRPDENVCENGVRRFSILVDALFGTGLTRPVRGFVEEFVRTHQEQPDFHDQSRSFVAVDLPTGICADSGKVLGEVWPSYGLTVTFHRKKLGHVIGEAPQVCGAVRVVDIGLGAGKKSSALDGQKIVSATPERPGKGGTNALGKSASSHKYAHGHALVVSGGVGKGGAARLAARGALRIGAGLVTLGCPPLAIAENAARLDATMLRPLPDTDALTELLEDRRINSLLIGPGHGGGVGTKVAVLTILAAGRSTVLDADALTAFADDPDELLEALHKDCVLTPHGGEFARMFPDLHSRLLEPALKGPAYSKVDATRQAAARAGCTVLYKGADTVIADQTGEVSVNPSHGDRAAPWLATAGAGDVLAGFIAGLMARGFSPKTAAETAAWLHVECARSFGPGLIAEDLPEELPSVFRVLGVT